MQGLFSSESIQTILQQLLPVLAHKISAGIERLMERWFGKK
jgi:hypothetical protein